MKVLACGGWEVPGDSNPKDTSAPLLPPGDGHRGMAGYFFLGNEEHNSCHFAIWGVVDF